MTQLQINYENSCNEYIKVFCKKQQLSFEGWAGNKVGGVACCGDYFFNLFDIVCDVNSKCKKGLILNWHDTCVEHPEKAINYFAYSKGLRL